MKTTNFRKRVMKYAHQIVKNGCTRNWSNILSQAWKCYKLSQRLKAEEVVFAYMKMDGSVRIANGTLNLPTRFYAEKKQTKPSYKTICYYDLEKHGFRSFRVENLIWMRQRTTC